MAHRAHRRRTRSLVAFACAVVTALCLYGAPAASAAPQFTAILLGTSQNAWSTDAALRAEYSKWLSSYSNVTPALRGIGFSKDDPTMAGWEASGIKYFW